MFDITCVKPPDPDWTYYAVNWIGLAIELLQRVCVVAIVAYMAMRFPPVRKALGGVQTSWQNQIYTIIFFGLLAILGTHLGLTYDSNKHCWSWATHGLQLTPNEAIIGLRDLMVLVAGIFGGVWIGLGAGILAGLERSYILTGSNVGEISAIATVILGLSAGLSHYFWPKWTGTAKGIFTISVAGTLIQKAILFSSPLFMKISADDVMPLVSWETTLPVLIANCSGCLLFLFVMKDLENDKIKIREQSAQLRALHAQVEPHFLGNMLTAVQSIILKDQLRAIQFLAKLVEFLNLTRKSASANSIRLTEELTQLNLYLEFQKVRFPNSYSYSEDIPESLLQCYIAPRTLQTLVENIFVHAMHGKKEVNIDIKGENLKESNTMRLTVSDTGCGITKERAETLGTQEVKSGSRHGSGSALHQIGQSLAIVFDKKASIKVESQLGEGTTVILTIPKRSEAW